GVAQLAGLAALVPPIPEEFAVAGKHLNPVVAGVGDVEVAVRAERQRPRAGEPARLAPRAAPAFDEVPVGIELADALILAEFGNVKVTVLVLDDVADVAELPRRGTGLAANFLQLFAVRRVDAQA